MSDHYPRLVSLLSRGDAVAIALSGGVDSALVAAAAVDADAEAMAVTVVSPVFAVWQRRQASDVAAEIGIRHVVVETDMLPPAGHARCARCKREMARLWKQTAAAHDFARVADGVTAADLANPARPGARMATEMGVWHPLAELELAEADIREMARERGLSVWNVRSEACLASGLPSDEPVTNEKMERIAAAEELLRDMSPRVRARVHGDLLRIELPAELFETVLEQREAIVARM
ncbi:MAG: asparagine synthase-related protein, partial [Thermoplasmatota archaeon]